MTSPSPGTKVNKTLLKPLATDTTQAKEATLCSECEDHPMTLFCLQCQDGFCSECFHAFHRKGGRKAHTTQSFEDNAQLYVAQSVERMRQPTHSPSKQVDPTTNPFHQAKAVVSFNKQSTTVSDIFTVPPSVLPPSVKYRWIVRAATIPLRLDEGEKSDLDILEAALNVSEYTDHIDVYSRGDKSLKIVKYFEELCAIVSGLAISRHYKTGQQLVKDKQFSKYADFFQHMFEVGRRYKVMNPDKMRTTYGKLIYAMMDINLPQVQRTLGFSCNSPIYTVHRFCEEKGILDMLNEDEMDIATREITGDQKSRETIQQELQEKEQAINNLIQKYSMSGSKTPTPLNPHDETDQEDVPEPLSTATPDDVRRVIYSLADNTSFLRSNSEPCQRMLNLLFYYFDPNENVIKPLVRQEQEKHDKKQKEKEETPQNEDNEEADDEKDDDGDDNQVEDESSEEEPRRGFFQFWNQPTVSSSRALAGPPSNTFKAKSHLSIRAGAGGARLSHSHPTQFNYVKQTLLLWREILNEFFALWIIAENDLLAENNYYHLRDTGQGLNRMQSCPGTSRAMSKVMGRVMDHLKEPWVGLSVVHLGDSNVPNAFVFLDKYTQVSRILNPILSVIERLPIVCAQSDAIRLLIETEYGSIELCRMEILQDFFRYGFDGSGADDGFSAGSCIDGRLTSAWNWCSKLEKKRFFSVFLLCGFIGFDGEF
ncbi:putative UPF0652 like protein [Blattamonas nauphoetae]|uniref:UPF0652 like protein n=1 Tax=Blattamonas nauphoetae TaxID=2049346 RepID=A0ABQ9XGR3_9EUKA|nr:putative UPF0652 like protein [Blattamonas nauphoetae]